MLKWSRSSNELERHVCQYYISATKLAGSDEGMKARSDGNEYKGVHPFALDFVGSSSNSMNCQLQMCHPILGFVTVKAHDAADAMPYAAILSDLLVTASKLAEDSMPTSEIATV